MLLADDQSILLDGIESLLGQIAWTKVVARANTGPDAVRLAKEHRPAVVLLDVNMPGMDGIEACRHILKDCPGTQVIMLTMYGNREFYREVMENGAMGYLL